MSSAAGTHTVVGQAFKEVREFDRAKVSARAGLIAAIPVAGMMALGIAIGSPTDAVTLGVGAMLVGVAWRAGDGPLIPPLATMAISTVVLPLCTLLGTLTGRWPWVHLGVLVIVCLLAGLATALGRRGISPGNQAIIAFVVFGRFPEDLANAAGLAGLVLAGGLAQTGFAALVELPAAWRNQRRAIARAYAKLAEASILDGTGAASAVALEDAEGVLAAPALFADPERATLVDLVAEGRRIRLELAVLASALNQAQREQPELYEQARPLVSDALAKLRVVLKLIVGTIGGYAEADTALLEQAAELSRWGAEREPLALDYVDGRLGALIGQVSAAARLAAAIDAPGAGALVVGRPTRGTRGLRSRIAYRLRTDYRHVRSHASLRAAAGRHAVRLAVVVAGTELLTQRVALPRGYWAVVAAATVLRPSFGATFTRGAERVLGTCLGVLIASLIAVAIDPSGWGLVVVVGLLAYVTYAVFPASFAVGTATLTAVIVFLLHAVTGDTVTTAFDRGIDTVIGGAIGLLAYALWPTWSARSAGTLLAELVDAQHLYLRAVLAGLVAGIRPDQNTLRAAARRARVSFADAEALVTLARSEPQRGDFEPAAAVSVLSALRRLVYAIHALRLQLEELGPPQPHPELIPLREAFDDALTTLSIGLRERGAQATLPPLRRVYRSVPWEAGDTGFRPAFDELVDAVDSAGTAAGLALA